MAKTLIEIGRAIAVRARLPIPATLVGNENETAALILQSIRDGTDKDAFRDADWVILQRQYTFETSGIENYAMPIGFDRIINNTVWDRTNNQKLIGPVSPQKWQAYKASLGGLTGTRRICRLRGQQADDNMYMSIYPDDAGTTLSGTGGASVATDPIDVYFEYISNQIIKVGGGVQDEIYSTSWSSDSARCVIDDDVIEAAALWRLLHSLGLSYHEEREEYTALLAERSANDGGAEVLNLARRPLTFEVNIPETGYGD